MIILCLFSFWLCTEVFISIIHPVKQFKENTKSFAIDSIDYHPPGKDNTLQVSPYWKCHLKGTNVWVRVNENREVGDSLIMIIK
jgi:hypothetical protein